MRSLILALLIAAAPAHAVEIFALHTDHTGSVVAVTDINRNVVERYTYEPYGLPTTPIEGPGYTGHVHDQASGLIYMQQRYYDPAVGRFLSIDPMAVDTANAFNFNRYNYAANNPYRFTDPDGRAVQFLWGAAIGAGVEIFVQTAIQGRSLSEIDVSDVMVAAGAGALTGGIASAGALAAARGAVSVGNAVAQTGAGAAAVGVTASLGRDVANGESPDVGRALVEGATAGVLGAGGQRLALAPAKALENMSANGGISAHVSGVTQTANIGSDAARVAAVTSQIGSNLGEAASVAAEAATAHIEDRWR